MRLPCFVPSPPLSQVASLLRRPLLRHPAACRSRGALFAAAARHRMVATCLRLGLLVPACAGALGFLAPPYVAAQECIDYGAYPRYVGRLDTPDYAVGVAVVGNLAYVADYAGGLRVIDITNPAAPAPVGALEWGSAADVAVAGSYAYVAGGNYSDLWVVGVSNPASPLPLSRVPTPGDPFGVAVSGNHLYVADGSAGLQVLDITDPASPRLVGSVSTPGSASYVAIAGNYAYVADVVFTTPTTQWTSALRVIDITNPAAPRIVGAVETPRVSTDVVASGHYVYVTNLNIFGAGGGFVVLDVSDPAAPRIVGVLDIGAGFGLALSGTLAIVSVHAGISLIDIADATAPRPVDFVPTAGQAGAIAVSGNLACVADGEAGLGVIDIANPHPPSPVSFVEFNSDTCGTRAAFISQDVALSGNHAYVAGWSALQVLDVTNPAEPSIVGSVGTSQTANSVAVSGNYAFVTEEYPDLPGKLAPADAMATGAMAPLAPMGVTLPSSRRRAPVPYAAMETIAAMDVSEPLSRGSKDSQLRSGAAHRMHVIDVSDPSAPQIVASLDMPGRAEGVAVSRGHAYVAVGSAGLLVLDMAIPAAPQVVATLDTPHYADAIAIAGDYAYVADWNSGLQVIDISNPTAPRIAGAIDTPDPAEDVAIAGNRAYVAGGWSGLHVVDITNPADPRLLGSVDPPGYVYAVALAGRRAYVADAYAGLLVVDVSNDEAPRVVGAADLRDQPLAIAVANDLVWVVGWLGLHIMPLQCPADVPVDVLLSGFTLTRSGGAVEARWTISRREGGSEFRLTAARGEERWSVPIEAKPKFDFLAVDRAAQLAAGGEVEYTLTFRDLGSSWKVLARQTLVLDGSPVVTRLFSPYPNPAHPRLVVPYVLGREQQVHLSVHDVLGREVVCLFSGPARAGAGQIVWSGEDRRGQPVAAGVYFVRFAGSEGEETRKVVVAR